MTLLLKKIMNSHVKHIFTMQIETRQDFKMTPIYRQSHYTYISRAVSCIYETEFEIWAGFGLASSTEVSAIMHKGQYFLKRHFGIFKSTKNIYRSRALKSEFCVKSRT